MVCGPKNHIIIQGFWAILSLWGIFEVSHTIDILAAWDHNIG